MHQPLCEKVSVSPLKPGGGQLPGCGEPLQAESLRRRGWERGLAGREVLAERSTH